MVGLLTAVILHSLLIEQLEPLRKKKKRPKDRGLVRF